MPFSESGLPKKVVVDLLSADEVLELLETGESTGLEILLGEVNLLEQFVELLCPPGHIPLTFEIR